MFREAFKETMDHFGVKSSDLAEISGYSPAYISQIRTNKKNPSCDRMEDLIKYVDQLAPGAKKYFGNLIADNPMNFSVEDLLSISSADELAQAIADLSPLRVIKSMDSDQLSDFIRAIADHLRGNMATLEQLQEEKAKLLTSK